MLEVAIQLDTVANVELANNNCRPAYVGYSVLVVDDSPVHRAVAERLLRKLGLSCLLAKDGREALSVLQKWPVGVVLMDCQMPVLDGLETTKIIRKLEEGEREQTIVIGCSTDASETSCRLAGMDDFIQKPLTIEAIERKLMPWCQPKLACA